MCTHIFVSWSALVGHAFFVPVVFRVELEEYIFQRAFSDGRAGSDMFCFVGRILRRLAEALQGFSIAILVGTRAQFDSRLNFGGSPESKGFDSRVRNPGTLFRSAKHTTLRRELGHL